MPRAGRPAAAEAQKFDPASEIAGSVQRYASVKAPVLALCALNCEKSSKAVLKGAPSAKFVAIANAGHFVFITHEEQVLREMNSFIAGLP